MPLRKEFEQTKISRETMGMKFADRRETYFVEPKSDPHISRGVSSASVTKSATMPTGHRVHTLDRGVFDRAVKAAAKDQK